ncbi:non-specific lipid-transfer protein-like protein [Artemisia annua]|uniref:Non-specific lipid-transfer protein-like protein n=1 Tax=Artemisia annua TaxID=35608 RepID=A0A2U1NW36_ARTAN|nr:non-specific lipid-transfer protein-like protein [Artemisia annua]
MAPKGTKLGLGLILVVMLWGETMAQSGCTTALISLSPCLAFVTSNSPSTPSSSCCSQLSNVVKSQPQCLCSLLNGGGPNLGISINQTTALSLPGACNVQTPPVSQCNAVANGPTPSTANGPTSSTANGPTASTTDSTASNSPSTSPTEENSPSTSPTEETPEAPTSTGNPTVPTTPSENIGIFRKCAIGNLMEYYLRSEREVIYYVFSVLVVFFHSIGVLVNLGAKAMSRDGVREHVVREKRSRGREEGVKMSRWMMMRKARRGEESMTW